LKNKKATGANLLDSEMGLRRLTAPRTRFGDAIKQSRCYRSFIFYLLNPPSCKHVVGFRK